jgi:hypothetical protein
VERNLACGCNHSFAVVCGVLALGLSGAMLAATAAAQERPRLAGVSAVRIANYGSPSVLLHDRERVGAVVSELNQLRQKGWRRGDTTLACYSTVWLMKGEKRVGEFRVRPDHVVERPVEKGQAIYSVAIDPSHIPTLTRLLGEIAPAKDCN